MKKVIKLYEDCPYMDIHRAGVDVELDILVQEAIWSSLCLPFDISYKDVTDNFGSSCRALKLFDIDNKKMYLELVDLSKGMKANTGYFICPTITHNKAIFHDVTFQEISNNEEYLIKNYIPYNYTDCIGITSNGSFKLFHNAYVKAFKAVIKTDKPITSYTIKR